MDIQSFYEPDSGTWTHLLADTASKTAAIIDPVWVFDPVSGQADEGFARQVLAAAARSGYRIEWILETHAHADHLTAADVIRRETGARIACGAGIRQVQRTFAPVFAMDGAATDGSQQTPLDRVASSRIVEQVRQGGVIPIQRCMQGIKRGAADLGF